VGAVAGAIIGAATHDEDDFLFSTGEDAVLGAVVFTPVGALTGTVIGLLVKTERWETFSLDRVAPMVSRGPDGRLSVGLKLMLLTSPTRGVGAPATVTTAVSQFPSAQNGFKRSATSLPWPPTRARLLRHLRRARG
jgi:hypothetical protein